MVSKCACPTGLANRRSDVSFRTRPAPKRAFYQNFYVFSHLSVHVVPIRCLFSSFSKSFWARGNEVVTKRRDAATFERLNADDHLAPRGRVTIIRGDCPLFSFLVHFKAHLILQLFLHCLPYESPQLSGLPSPAVEKSFFPLFFFPTFPTDPKYPELFSPKKSGILLRYTGSPTVGSYLTLKFEFLNPRVITV